VKKTSAAKSVRAKKRPAAPIGNTKPRRAASSSLALVNRLTIDLGERRVSSILRKIRDDVQPALRIRDAAKTELAKLQAANAARLEAKRAVILADAVNSDDAGRFIARTRPIANKLAKTGELLAIQDGRFLKFPRWQFDEHSEDGLVPGFRHVLSVMDASPFRKAAWLISPNPHFAGRAPIELLRDGQRDRVYEEAKAVTSG
jgi:hypothetical protein